MTEYPEDIFFFDVVEENKNADGTHTITFNADDGFKEWFMKTQGLKRWSQKRFQKVFVEALEKYMNGKTFKEMRSEMKKLNVRSVSNSPLDKAIKGKEEEYEEEIELYKTYGGD